MLQPARESAPVTKEEAPAPNPTLTFRASTQEVVVDVVVTDLKGHPVSGLKADDFNLTEDGTVQRISYFKEDLTTRTTQPTVFQRSPNTFSNVSDTEQPDSVTLILFDMLNTPVQDQARARDALTRYIKTKPKNESFALCVLGGSLRLVRGFTSDENELLLGMQDRRLKPSAPLISQLDTASLAFIRSVAHSLDNASDTTRRFAIAMAGLERTVKDEQLSLDDMRTYMTISAFTELARYMAGVPGRKKVEWLSAAFPLGTFAGAGSLDAGPFHQQRDFLPLVRHTMNLLASAHVSVYPVDVRGVMLNTVDDVSEAMPFGQNLPNSPLTSPSGTGQQLSSGGTAASASAARNMANDHAVSENGFSERNLRDSAGFNSEHAAMDLVAEQTGGQAFYGSNNIADALRTIVEQGSDYYTLSYAPANRKYDGRFRTIGVKVAGHNYRVSHRSGYYAEDSSRLPPKAEAILNGLAVAGMMHGAPESRQVPFQVRLAPVGEPKTVSLSEAGIRVEGKGAASTIKLQHYRVDYAITAGPLRFDPSPDGYFHGRFRLLANSFDSDGRTLLQASSTAVADIKIDTYQKILSEGLRLRQELDVPIDASFLRLGVKDVSGTSIGTLEFPVPIPIPKDDPQTRKDGAMPPVEPE